MVKIEVSYKWERFIMKIVESTNRKHMKIFRMTLNEMEVSVIKTLKRDKKNYLGQHHTIPLEISERKTAFHSREGKFWISNMKFLPGPLTTVLRWISSFIETILLRLAIERVCS